MSGKKELRPIKNAERAMISVKIDNIHRLHTASKGIDLMIDGEDVKQINDALESAYVKYCHIIDQTKFRIP